MIMTLYIDLEHFKKLLSDKSLFDKVIDQIKLMYRSLSDEKQAILTGAGCGEVKTKWLELK